MFNDAQLAKILTERSLIDPTTLKKAQNIQGEGSLYEAISKDQLVAVETLRELSAELFEIPSAEIRSYHIDAKLIKLVPSSMAFRNRVIPLELNESALVLGMFDPTDLLAMDEISMRTGISIKPMGVDPRELTLALEEYYGGHDELHSFDGLLDSIDSPDVDNLVDDVMSEMGWDEMFEGEDVPEDEAQKMRDRPTTGVLDIDSGDIEIADDDSLLEGLDDPISADGAYYELDEWEIDSEIDSSEPKSALIMSKDSADVFFGNEEGGIAKVDAPLTREVDGFREPALTPLSSIAIESDSPKQVEGATQEITPNVLESIFNSSPYEGEISSLEEKTAAHPDEVNRLTGIMKTLSGKNPSKKPSSITKNKTVVALANEVDFKIPEGVSDRFLIESVVRLLVAQGLIDKDALLELLNA